MDERSHGLLPPSAAPHRPTAVAALQSFALFPQTQGATAREVTAALSPLPQRNFPVSSAMIATNLATFHDFSLEYRFVCAETRTFALSNPFQIL